MERIMKRIVLALMILVSVFFDRNVGNADPVNPEVELQEIINRSDSNQTVVLPPGTYQGPISINKRITLQGEGVTLINDSQEPAVSIQSDGVVLQGIQIEHQGSGESAGILIGSNHVTIKNTSIHTRGYGIMLRDSNQSVIQNNRISWIKSDAAHPESKGNGIDLYNSHSIQVINNVISYVRDGIYMEKGRNETVKGNEISFSRYGVHCMYIGDSQVTGNVGQSNFTGAMVMVVTNSNITNNSFRMQSGNVYSQGIFLYDVRSTYVSKNQVAENRVGIYMENATENEIEDNTLSRNFIGIQMINATENGIRRNHFLTNVIEASAKDSKNNQMDENYWDSFQGIDLTKDGASDIPYAINPFYQGVVSVNSAYQLFFQSPGMTFLSSMFTYGRSQWATDHSPLMNMTEVARNEPHPSESNRIVSRISPVLFILATFTIVYFGRIRR
ncbi:nitrous oxide reductase family maturation protein NosD [Paenibacillus sp. XY044]|uniref:right-handed parallel beta-helix repeat-containing protein n=1 Tax=Paenibacillus sp. XY044 TaxID=2026089 RepID=UPI0015C5E719|nr:NosD domain-containing protein [Paenibacillus sp. XY044]